MERPKFVVPSGYGQRQRKLHHYSQAVKLGNRVELAGQGGWTDDFEFPPTIREEYLQAFHNVERVLQAAGASWNDVVSVNSYHAPMDDAGLGIMTEQFRLRMPSHCPIYTCVGVSRLADPRMHVEISVTAFTSP
jgi:enamine deaminase RidA (YjgF/YER057c/UK114 family)